MNCIKFFVFGAAVLYTAMIFANGNINTYTSPKPKSPACKTYCRKVCRRVCQATPQDKRVKVTLYPGSLKDNIVNIARQNGWRNIVWDGECGTDFRWVSKTKIIGNTFQEVMTKILSGYPLQAIFYTGNRVLVIKPRTLK